MEVSYADGDLSKRHCKTRAWQGGLINHIYINLFEVAVRCSARALVGGGQLPNDLSAAGSGACQLTADSSKTIAIGLRAIIGGQLIVQFLDELGFNGPSSSLSLLLFISEVVNIIILFVSNRE